MLAKLAMCVTGLNNCDIAYLNKKLSLFFCFITLAYHASF